MYYCLRNALLSRHRGKIVWRLSMGVLFVLSSGGGLTSRNRVYITYTLNFVLVGDDDDEHFSSCRQILKYVTLFFLNIIYVVYGFCLDLDVESGSTYVNNPCH